LEFALVAPVLLLIVFATIEYGWYLTHCVVMNNAVAEGARAGVKARQWETATHGKEDPVQFAETALTEALWTQKNLLPDHIDIRVIEADETAPRRIVVTVSDVPYEPLTGYLGKTMLPEILAAKTVMVFP
jgi:Flp pilus assembly protein TadG